MMDFEAFWAEMWARCGPAYIGFEQCEAARDVYEGAKAKIEAAERERWRDVEQFLVACADDSMSRNNRQTLALELLEQIRA